MATEKKQLTVSVIAPIYGVEPYIGQFAESLLSQTYDGIQFIFVNDGTKDNSMGVLKNLIESRFSHLKDRITIVDKQNEGLPKARETGLKYATGDYILHVDSDDWLETDTIECLVRKAEETQADIVYYDFYKEYSYRSKKDVEREYTAADKSKFIANLMNYRAYGYVWNKMTKRSLYLDNKIYFPLYPMHEDIYLVSQLICYSSSIAHLNKALYHYRRTNPGSITAKNKIKRRKDSVMNMLNLYEHFRDNIAGSPAEPMKDTILLRAGWFSLIYGFDLFSQYDYLLEDVRKVPISLRHRLFLPCQVILRIYVNNLRKKMKRSQLPR